MFIAERMWLVFTVVTAKMEDRRNDERGITAIEYALMAAGIAVIIGAALLILKDKITAIFNGIPNTPTIPAS